MSITIGTYEAKAKLSKLLEKVKEGEEIVITKHGVPVARILPFKPTPPSGAAETVAEFIRAREHITLGGLSIERLRECPEPYGEKLGQAEAGLRSYT